MTCSSVYLLFFMVRHSPLERTVLFTLVRQEGRRSALPVYERVAHIYDFVQNEIAFGYNEADNIPASEVYRDGYGQCNTKGTLIMALLRKCQVPCRFHGGRPRLQKSAHRVEGHGYIYSEGRHQPCLRNLR